MFLDEWPVEDDHTDACRVAPGFFQGGWLYHNFAADSPEHALLHINHKETLAIIFAAKRWHQLWANNHSDNKTAVNIINKGSTPNQTIMTELRQLFWLSALFDFRITAQYIKGKHRGGCDFPASRGPVPRPHS